MSHGSQSDLAMGRIGEEPGCGNPGACVGTAMHDVGRLVPDRHATGRLGEPCCGPDRA